MAPDGEKMSKSKGNVIDPMEIMDSGYGADSLRLYEMFIAPYDQDAPWDTRGVPGTYRFLNRVWTLVQEYLAADNGDANEAVTKELARLAHGIAKKITQDIEDEKFNTAVSSMMETVNALYKLKDAHGIVKSPAWQQMIENLLMVLAPFAPHITEELWHQLGHADTIHVDHWPEWDESLLVADEVTIVVQVNGKVRARLACEKGADQAAVEALVYANEHVMSFIDDKQPAKVIYVPDRLLNIVVK
ncbi:MAG: class I tRNA ligase family protein [Candidatus Saccharibacteria bacterium]|nr:class I tRNA ligase family protein [Candidatus Saccharibacteria bacterium]